MPADLSRNWVAVEASETVSYCVRTAQGQFAPNQTVTYGKRRAATKSELQMAGSLHSVGLVWHLWTAKLGGVVPKINDVLEDASGIRWTIRMVEKHALGQRWRLTTEQSLPTTPEGL